MVDRTKKALAALALAVLVAIPVTAAAVNTPGRFAHDDSAQMRFMTGPGGSPAGIGGHGGVMTGQMGSHQGAIHGQMGMSDEMTMVESEFDYLARMIPHHEEAIASAEVLLAGTDRPEMEVFAREIIATQSAEVAGMQEWLATWYPEQDLSVDYEPMMRDLGGLTGDRLDQAFLEDMIGHHMAAVMMSQQLVTGGLAEHPEVVPFAQQIRDSQHTEIFQMSGWLTDWFGESPMGSMGFGH